MSDPEFLTLDEVLAIHDELVALVVGVAEGRVGKAEVAAFLEDHVIDPS